FTTLSIACSVIAWTFKTPLRISITSLFFFFFNDTATTEIYTLSLHDALPISSPAGCCCPWPESESPLRGDRKSTRLNSSHGSSSYAVFCLKKKKKQKPRL